MPSDWLRPAFAGPFTGEALALWRLRREAGNLRCFVTEWPSGFWLGIECAGGELVLSETLPSVDAVVTRAAALKASLINEGWLEE